VQLAAPADEKVPAAQVKHVAGEVAPDEDEDVPAEHCMQLEAPANEYVPPAQLSHVAFEVAFNAAEKVPAAHAVQLEAPAGEKVPAMQVVQFDAPTAGEYEPAVHR
jgi:hypothetical protein